jgi:hypothetical protein
VRCVRVHTLGQGPERDATVAPVGYDVEQVGQRAPEPIHFPNDQRVTALQSFQTSLDAGAVITRAGSIIIEEVTGIGAGGNQGATLKSGFLSAAFGRHVHIAHQHMRKPSGRISRHNRPFRKRLSRQNARPMEGGEGNCSALSVNRCFLACRDCREATIAPYGVGKMGSEHRTVPSNILSAVLLIVLAITVSSCSPSPLIPYAVEIAPPAPAAFSAMPEVSDVPIQSTSDYREFKATDGTQTYLVPVRLAVVTGSNRAAAIMLESHDGKRAIFQAIVGPLPLSDHDHSKPRPTLYPIDKMSIRTLTSSQDTSVWRVTITSEPLRSQPFTLLVSIQIFGRDNISSFKAMLRGEEGFLLETIFTINTESNSRFEIGIPVSLNHLLLTEQTM